MPLISEKKPKIIGMISSYHALENRSDWLWQQTPHAFGVWNNVQIQALAPKPDFLLMYQFNFLKKGERKNFFSRFNKIQNSDESFKTLLREVPKDRIVYLLREPPLSEVIERHKSAYLEAQKYCGYVSGPDDFAPKPDYMPAIWYHANSFRDLEELPIPEKISNCSWITSGISRTANHRHRLDFLKALQESGVGVDCYGRNLPAWAKSLGVLNNKWNAMAPYYYNLAIENYSSNSWYVSEKLWDALLAWCLPIYYGGSAADKLLPPKSFIRLPSLDAKGIAYIQEVISNPDMWNEAIDAIAEARKIILHELNLLKWLSDFVRKN